MYYYDEHKGKVWYVCGENDAYYSPLPNAVCVVYDGTIHYDYLKVKEDWKARADQSNTEMRFLVAGDVIEYRKKKCFKHSLTKKVRMTVCNWCR